MSENIKHNDCKNFCFIDAAKGICRVSNEMIFNDTEICENFHETNKCKNCSNFKDVNKDNVGNCVGFKKEAWTYSELNAVTCEGYKCNK